jgi:hypothetical protein
VVENTNLEALQCSFFSISVVNSSSFALIFLNIYFLHNHVLYLTAEQAWITTCVVRASLVKFELHVGNMKVDTK